MEQKFIVGIILILIGFSIITFIVSSYFNYSFRTTFDKIIFPLIWLIILISFLISFLIRQLGLPFWMYYIVLIILGLVLYFVNAFLIKHFIDKRAPQFASAEDMGEGYQKWELTAGTGIVPKWVSWIGLASIACFIALLFPAVASIFR